MAGSVIGGKALLLKPALSSGDCNTAVTQHGGHTVLIGSYRQKLLSWFSERIPPLTAGVNRVGPVPQSTRVCPAEYPTAQYLL